MTPGSFQPTPFLISAWAPGSPTQTMGTWRGQTEEAGSLLPPLALAVFRAASALALEPADDRGQGRAQQQQRGREHVQCSRGAAWLRLRLELPPRWLSGQVGASLGPALVPESLRLALPVPRGEPGGRLQSECRSIPFTLRGVRCEHFTVSLERAADFGGTILKNGSVCITSIAVGGGGVSD